MKTFVLIFVYFFAIVGRTCAKSQDPKCLLPMEPGPCRMKLERYYFNTKTRACETFTFGGCRGNENKFGFRQTCEEACLLTSAAPATRTAAVVAPAATTTTTKPTTRGASVNNNKPIKQ